MNAQMNPNASVKLTCAGDGCRSWQRVIAKHIANLTAAGPWRCNRCKRDERPTLSEPPC